LRWLRSAQATTPVSDFAYAMAMTRLTPNGSANL